MRMRVFEDVVHTLFFACQLVRCHDGIYVHNVIEWGWGILYTLRNEVGVLLFLPNEAAKRSPQDGFKFVKPRHFVAKSVWHEAGEFGHFESVTTKDIYEQSDLSTSWKALKRSRFHFLKSKEG